MKMKSFWVPEATRAIRRVSTFTPPTTNSFQNRVPTGTDQWSMSWVSTFEQAGSFTHRVLTAPSDHSAWVGWNSRTPAATPSFEPIKLYRPVAESVGG